MVRTPNKDKYDHGDVVTICATPSIGWHFVNWYENGIVFTTETSTEITMTGTRTLSALFEIDTHTLTLHVEGEGTATKEPDRELYDYGEEATLTAIPNEGWRFIEWKGDVTGTNTVETVIIDSDKEATAVFALSEFSPEIEIEGDGEITIEPSGTKLIYGQVATFTANPLEGWHFVGWTGTLEGLVILQL